MRYARSLLISLLFVAVVPLVAARPAAAADVSEVTNGIFTLRMQTANAGVGRFTLLTGNNHPAGGGKQILYGTQPGTTLFTITTTTPSGGTRNYSNADYTPRGDVTLINQYASISADSNGLGFVVTWSVPSQFQASLHVRLTGTTIDDASVLIQSTITNVSGESMTYSLGNLLDYRINGDDGPVVQPVTPTSPIVAREMNSQFRPGTSTTYPYNIQDDDGDGSPATLALSAATDGTYKFVCYPDAAAIVPTPTTYRIDPFRDIATTGSDCDPEHGDSAVFHEWTGTLADHAAASGISALNARPTWPNAVTTVAVTKSGSTVVGQPVTLTAHVSTDLPNANTPSGSIDFVEGGALIGSAPLDGSGTASKQFGFPTAGTHGVRALYSGDSFVRQGEGAIAFTIAGLSARLVVAVSPASPQPASTAMTLTASVTPASGAGTTPTGSVTFHSGSLTQTVNLNGNGQATATFSNQPAGVYDTTETYNGSSNYGSVDGYATYVLGTPPSYRALTPYRILDTRPGELDSDGFNAPLTRNHSIEIPVTAIRGVPATGVEAVALNVTVTNPETAGFLTVYPDAAGARPNVSNLNFVAGETRPNLVVAKVGPDGNIAIFDSDNGSVDVIVDLQGWFPTGGAYHAVNPQRVLDTRPGELSGDGRDVALGPGESVDLVLTNKAAVPSAGVNAVLLNVTATAPTAPGFLTVSPTGQPVPNASNVNFVAEQTTPNAVLATLGTGGAVHILNGSNSGSVHVIVDVQGWLSQPGPYTGLTPTRLVDTRPGQASAVDDHRDTPLAPGETMSVKVTGVPGVPATGVAAVALNVTPVGATAPGFLTVFPNGQARPLSSNVNFLADDVAPNLVIATVGDGGYVQVYNGSAGSVHVVVDLSGWLAG